MNINIMTIEEVLNSSEVIKQLIIRELTKSIIEGRVYQEKIK